MLDPISAIGLTASIVQLVTFSEGLIRRTSDIYHSVDGSLVQHTELESIVTSFSELLDVLRNNQNAFNLSKQKSNQVSADTELDKLAADTRLVIEEILQVIRRLKGNGNSSRGWYSVRQALLTIINENKLKDLEQRLDRLRKQIDTSLLNSLWQTVPQSAATHAGDVIDIKARLEKLTNESSVYSSILKQLHEHMLLSEQERNTLSHMPNFTAMISAEDDQKREKILRSRLIDSFRFEDMPNRYEAIPKAYHTTFEWVFTNQYSPTPIYVEDGSATVNEVDGSRQSFISWLESSEKLYWITGKPGAGKSTLMKFLANHTRTLQGAQRWVRNTLPSNNSKSSTAEGSQALLRTAAYFFWNPGSSMQKSKCGLCQTLLYQLFKQDPELVTDIFPDRWTRCLMYGGDKRPFSWAELWAGLQNLLKVPTRRFVLFIDGLDEIDEKPAELASLILQLSVLPLVKVCAASRPWLEFEDPFRNVPKLQVEELTRPDIENYVNGQLSSSPAFEMLRLYDGRRAREIVQDVTKRASGVFLWVYVVVESLLEGLRDGDSFLQLEQRLHELPTELDDLFTRILKQVPPRYAEEASELFQLVRKHPDDATILGVYLAQQPVATALRVQIGRVGNHLLEYPLDCMRRRIYSRCKCLLQVSTPCKKWHKVNYLHRTVRDYLLLPQNWDSIQDRSPAYDPDCALAISLLQQVKQGIGVPEIITESGEEWELSLIRAVYFVAATTTLSLEDKIAFLDEVGQVRTTLRSGGKTTLVTVTNWPWGPKHKVKNLPPDSVWAIQAPQTIFQLAFGAGFTWYIDAKVRKDPMLLASKICERYPLFLAVELRLWQVIKALLQHGADPNHISPADEYSSWAMMLKATYFSCTRELSQAEGRQYLQMLCLFLDKKASPRLSWQGPKPEQVIELALSQLKGKEYEQERRLLTQKFEEALKRDKVGRRLTFKGIRS